ncbi:MAG: hypothetical protein Q7S01_03780 [bacterium]|nr:hypothetical protein [bacterium]
MLEPILAGTPTDSRAPRALWLCTLWHDWILYTGASTRPPAPPHSLPYASISRGFLKIEWVAGRIFKDFSLGVC